jgi:hypothetical protein
MAGAWWSRRAPANARRWTPPRPIAPAATPAPEPIVTRDEIEAILEEARGTSGMSCWADTNVDDPARASGGRGLASTADEACAVCSPCPACDGGAECPECGRPLGAQPGQLLTASPSRHDMLVLAAALVAAIASTLALLASAGVRVLP